MAKVVINVCFGGFGLSDLALEKFKKLKKLGKDEYPNYRRDDEDLIKVIEELGEKANGDCADLKIVEVPDGVKWEIEECDGNEWVAEVHRRWF